MAIRSDKMINSFKMTAGQQTLRTALIYSMIPTVINLVFGILLKLIQNEHLRDFVDGFVSTSAGICLEVAAMMSVCIIYNSNNKAMPGYRFFHSVSGGEDRFKRGLIFANLLSLIADALYAISGLLLLPHKEFIALMAIAMLFSLGWVNLFGSLGKMFLSIVPLFVLGMIFGFIAGYEDEEFFGLLTSVPIIIAMAAIIIFYIISAVYVIRNAKKIWNREV